MNVKHVAQLANLSLTVGEEKKYSSQLNKVLDYVSHLQKLNVQNVVATSQVTGKSNSLRDDNSSSCLAASDAISQAKSSHHNYIVVPAIFDNE